jgi:uncharacterized protein (TIRG00374 family)
MSVTRISTHRKLIGPGIFKAGLLLAGLVVLYVVVPQLNGFHGSITSLRNVRSGYALAALACSVATYLFAALTYYCLAPRPLQYARTLVVEVAATFINHLLPAGVGGIGTNYAYLRQSGCTEAQAAATVTANNVLGVVGHLLLLLVVLLLFPADLPALHVHLSHMELFLILAGMLLVVGLVVKKKSAPRLLKYELKIFFHQLSDYRHHPLRLLAALLSSLCLTAANVACLWCSVLAVHSSLGFVPVLLIFSFGLALGTITPTPGGIGGIESGLVAGLVAYRLDASIALIAVLFYRLISFWLMLVAGAGAFMYAQRCHYFRTSSRY